MNTRYLLAVSILLVTPAWSADSLFVEDAFKGKWGLYFPELFPQKLDSVVFTQIDDGVGRTKVDELGRGLYTADELCPGPGERSEYYEVTYQRSNQVAYFCTGGTTINATYRDADGSGFGKIEINRADADANPPEWSGRYTDSAGLSSAIVGRYEGDGIETPLALLSNGNGGGGGPTSFTGCRFEVQNRNLHLHHPALYSALGQMFLGVPPPQVGVLVLEQDEPVAGANVGVTSSTPSFPGANGFPEFSNTSGLTNVDGKVSFVINPPKPEPTDLVIFTAKVTIAEKEYQCKGAVTTGFGIELKFYMDKFDARMDEVEVALEDVANGGDGGSGSGGNGGASGAQNPTNGCLFTPQNRHMPVHHPALYTSLGQMFLGLAPPELSVQVWKDDQPLAGTTLALNSSAPVFPGDTGYPELSSISLTTDGDGAAAFTINPPRPDPSDSFTLTANVTIEGIRYECTGTATTGMGIELKPYLDKFDERMDEIEAQLTQLALGPQPAPEDEAVVAALPLRAPAEKDAFTFSRLPLVFEENRGQARDSADFLARAAGVGMLLDSHGVRVQSGPGSDQAIGMEIVGANNDTIGRVVERLSGKSNYLLGADPQHWIAGVGQAAKVQYDAVYPGIDVVYFGNQQRLEYDFVIAPGADPERIQLRFGDQVPASVDEIGDLVLQRGDFRLKLKKPRVYQQIGDQLTDIASAYRVDPQGNVGFTIESYDRTQTLVIDPVLEFAGYLGGTGEDIISDVALDAEGNIYVTGTTSSPSIATAGAFKTVNQGGGIGEIDGFIAKLNPEGSELLFLTYVGGSKDDSPFSLVVDTQGNVLVTGETTSEDFPTMQPLQGQLANGFGFGGVDAFVLKLNPQGSALVYSTFLGGGLLELKGKIDVDSAGNAYVVSSTTSTDVPVVNALQPVRGGNKTFGPDALVAKLNPTGQPIYITYLGGSAEDWGFSIAADSSGNAWVVGSTTSNDFPAVNSFEGSYQGGGDVFLAKISADGKTLLSSGFLGGASDEMAEDVAVDGSGNVYITGSTGSAEFPIVGAAPDESMNAGGLGLDAFVAKFSPDGVNLLYSKFFGGAGTEFSHGITVGGDGSAYITGDTDSKDLPLKGAVQTYNAGHFDAFVAKLNPDGSEFDYSTYLGGTFDDGAPALAVDANGNVIAVGLVYSPDFPVTIGAFQTSPESSMESFIAKLAPGDPPPSVVSLSAASYVRVNGLAPDSFATAFGENLAAGNSIDSSLPTSLGGVSITITDSNGKMHAARLYTVGATQVNYVLPPDVASGLATISVTRDGQVVATETARINPVAPGFFTAARNGAGVAAAVYLLARPDGTRDGGITFDQNFAPVPLDLGPEGSQLYVSLYGTGMRNSTGPVSVTIDGSDIPFAGPVAQGEFAALDQLNLGPLPRSLAGRSDVEIVITIDGKEANVLTLSFQ